MLKCSSAFVSAEFVLGSLMAMVVPPCAASAGIVSCAEVGQPCVVWEVSRSRRRRMRERRVAVRRAQQQSLCILEVLQEPYRNVQSKITELRAEAEEFIPSGIAVDCDSLYFAVEVDDLTLGRCAPAMHKHPEQVPFTESVQSLARELLDCCFAEALPSIPGVVASECKINNNLCVPSRKSVADTRSAEGLPCISTPLFTSVTGEGDSIISVVPVVCRGPGHSSCSHCYFLDGRFGRHRKCIRKCSDIEGLWGPTVCSPECRPAQSKPAEQQEDAARSGTNAPETVSKSSSAERKPAWANAFEKALERNLEKLCSKFPSDQG